jgi:DNA-directed RNA polymerase specialized sigma24 family protein
VLRRFLSDARESAGRIKRGGAATFVPADGPSLEELCADPRGADPASAFDRAWLVSLIDHAVGRLRQRIRPEQFRVFEAHDLAPDAERPSYASLASRFGLTEDQVRRLLSTLRGELREEMRAELRRQTGDDREFDEEWNALRGL